MVWSPFVFFCFHMQMNQVGGGGNSAIIAPKCQEYGSGLEDFILEG